MAREKKYSQDVEAAVNAGAKLNDVELSKKGKDKKTYVQASKAIVFNAVSQILAFCGNDENELFELFSKRVANQMIQANDYRNLLIAAEGPEKAIEDTVASLLDNKMFDTAEDAIEFAVGRMIKSGQVPEDYKYAGKLLEKSEAA